MKTILKYIFETIGYIISWITPNDLPELWRANISHIYTGFLRRHFGSFGHNSLIAYKANKLKGLEYINIGCNTQISKGVLLTAWKEYNGEDTGNPEIIIGDNCTIRDFCHITAINSIRIGSNLLTGTNVLITDNSHGANSREEMNLNPSLRKPYSKGPVVIGDNVWLGNNVCVMPGVSIGDGAVVGANSIVTHDVPSYSIAAGIPAKEIKQIK